MNMTRLCPDPGGIVTMKVGITDRISCRSTTSGWTYIRLLHHLAHRKHNMTRHGLSFLPVTFGHPTGICGRRRLHHLHDVPDDVADACLPLYLSMYARDVCMLPMYAVGTNHLPGGRLELIIFLLDE